MVRSAVGLACWLVAVTALAQMEVKAKTYFTLEGATKATVINKTILFEAATEVKAKPVGIIEVETEASQITVEAEKKNREPVPSTKLRDNLWMIDGTGSIWIDVTAIDFEKQIYEKKKLVIDVGPPVPPEPDDPDDPDDPDEPDDPDGPDIPPDGPFDGLASKVQKLANGLGPDDKNQIAGVCSVAADKMKSYEFKQVSQARDYIKRNWPQCKTNQCVAIYNLVVADARTRTLGWQEIQAYYREVAKGVQ